MTPPESLVQAAAEAIERGLRPIEVETRRDGTFTYYDADPEELAVAALAAAFGALPVDEIREQAREAAVRLPIPMDGEDVLLIQHGADAASDVWVAALAREFGEGT